MKKKNTERKKAMTKTGGGPSEIPAQENPVLLVVEDVISGAM